jgi:3-deoxy-D-manno-octulosonic-acid transferase
MIFLYRIIFLIVILIGSPFLLLKIFIGKHGLKERFGFIDYKNNDNRLFWFHAASVGELKVLSSILPEIKRRDDSIKFAISTTTMTGQKRAKELFGDIAKIFLIPIEMKSCITRVIKKLKPEKFITIETEIWPLLCKTADSMGIKLNMINGRMTSRSFPLYKIFKPFFKTVLKRFENILVQTAIYAARYKDLGARNIRVVGNVKYDQVFSNKQLDDDIFNIQKNESLIFTMGSIRRGEYQVMIDAIKEAQDKSLPFKFVLVPRHLKDIKPLCLLVKKNKVIFKLRSEAENIDFDDYDLLIVDSMGELLKFYNISDLTFVGGSLVHIGGHDPVEPASLGKAVLFGPHMENSLEAATALNRDGGAVQVSNRQEIIKLLEEITQDRSIAQEMGVKAKNTILSLSGATKRTVDLLLGEKS